MKVRTDFVTNSSSSSYIIIGKGDKDDNIKALAYIAKKYGELSIGGNLGGTTEFGWEVVKYDTLYDRINFAWLIAKYNETDHADWMVMLMDCLKKRTGCENITSHITMDYDHEEDKVWGYIDHQSVDRDNFRMFDSEEDLDDFIFSDKSYIQGDNDNH